MSDNVVKFPGLVYGKIEPSIMAQNIVEEAEKLDSMIVCGFTKEGQFYYATSEGENKENLWIAENLRLEIQAHIMGGDDFE